jgi:transcription elongation GreA/GreB family factor
VPATDKAALKAALLEQLAATLASARRAHEAATEGATHSESRAENAKDTRGLELSYLARGQAQRVAELEAGIAELSALALRTFGPADPVALSALVTVEYDDRDDAVELFLVPYGGGTDLPGSAVQIVTPQSPLGRAVLGKRADDDVELRVAGRVRALAITNVR